MYQRLKGEVALAKVGFSDVKAVDTKTWATWFGTSGCCPTTPLVFLFFRAFNAALFVAVLIWSLAATNYIDYWLIYLTHWTLMAEVVYLLFAFATTFKCQEYLRNGTDLDGVPWFVQTTWFLQSITYPGTFIVFAFYWLLVYNGGTVYVIGVMVHGVNYFVIFLDMWASRQPFIILHFIYIFLFAFVFSVFALIYSFSATNPDGDSYIYSVLDWKNKAGTAAFWTCAMLLIILPIVWTVMWCAVYSRSMCCPVPVDEESPASTVLKEEEEEGSSMTKSESQENSSSPSTN